MRKIRRGIYFQTGFRYCDESFTVSASLYAARVDSKPRAKIYLGLQDDEKQLLVHTINNCTEEQLESVLTEQIHLMESCSDGSFSGSIFEDAADRLMFEDYEDEEYENLDLDEEPELHVGFDAMNDLRLMLTKYTSERLVTRMNILPVEEALRSVLEDAEYEGTPLPDPTKMYVKVTDGKAEVTLTFPGCGELVVQQIYKQLKGETVFSYHAMEPISGEQIVTMFHNPESVKKQRTENDETVVVLTYQIREDTVASSYLS